MLCSLDLPRPLEFAMHWFRDRPVFLWVFSVIQLLGVGVFVIGATSICGHITKTPQLYSWTTKREDDPILAMALNTAICITMLGASTFYLSFGVSKLYYEFGMEKPKNGDAGALAFAVDAFLICMIVLCIFLVASGRSTQALTVMVPMMTFYFGRVSERGPSGKSK